MTHHISQRELDGQLYTVHFQWVWHFSQAGTPVVPPPPTKVTSYPALLVTAAVDVIPDLTALTQFFIQTRETSITRYVHVYSHNHPTYTCKNLTNHDHFLVLHLHDPFAGPSAFFFRLHCPVYASVSSFLSSSFCVPLLLFQFFHKLHQLSVLLRTLQALPGPFDVVLLVCSAAEYFKIL